MLILTGAQTVYVRGDGHGAGGVEEDPQQDPHERMGAGGASEKGGREDSASMKKRRLRRDDEDPVKLPKRQTKKLGKTGRSCQIMPENNRNV